MNEADFMGSYLSFFWLLRYVCPDIAYKERQHRARTMACVMYDIKAADAQRILDREATA